MPTDSKRTPPAVSAPASTGTTDRSEHKHPNTLISEIVRGDAEVYAKLMRERLGRDIFDLWTSWLLRIMRDRDIDAKKDLPPLYVALQNRSFRNGDFVMACEWIEGTRFRFPHLMDFVACPDIHLPGKE